MNPYEKRFDIEEHNHRMVRWAVSTEGELCDAIMHLAMGPKKEWTPEEIDALNRELDSCKLKIGEWRRAR